MRWSCCLLLVALFSLFSSPAEAQEATYTPSKRSPQGTELVALFITQSTCIWSNKEGFDRTVHTMKSLLAQQAAAHEQVFSITGVSLDWDPAVGVEYLSNRFGAFDEVIAGRNWFNSAAVQWIWRAEGGRAATPQLILLRRTVNPEQRTITFGSDEKVLHLLGSGEIAEWVQKGAPIPAAIAAKSP